MKNYLIIAMISSMLLVAGCSQEPAEVEDDDTVIEETDESTDQIEDESSDEADSETAIFTMAEVEAHASEESCYTTIDGKVYDVTSFISKHPGGDRNILKICGSDGTSLFEGQHGGQEDAENTLDEFYIGELES